MAGEDMLMLRQEEIRRLHVIRKVLEGIIKQVKAAELLSLSARHIRRIVKRVKEEGDGGMVHRARGRVSNRKKSNKVKEKAIELYRTRYKDFGPTLATEKLWERDGIRMSDETLRRWLIEAGEWKKVRKRRTYRQWRERKPHLGEMIQMDGSHHKWFEDRGSESVLIGYIDDATGKVFGRFYDHEGTVPAMDSFRRYIKKNGIPLKVYLDKHAAYKTNAKPTVQEELAQVEPLSQFERALKELGVEVIHAHSPQAKGRIERLFRTLQDRLIKEMRLREINTMEEANRFLETYLPLYNKRFSVCPKANGNLHRPLVRAMVLDQILCVRTERALRKDFTVLHNRKLYQVEDIPQTSKVVVQDRLDGSMVMTAKDRSLRFREITERPKREEKPPRTPKIRKPYSAPLGHPWGEFRFGKHRYERGKFIESKP
jgi:transposase-like protein